VHSLEVLEPAKAAVLAWRPGQPIGGAVARRAFAVVRENMRTYEVTIDLASGMAQRVEVPGVQPGLLPEEYGKARDAAIADSRFQRGLAARGVATAAARARLFCWTSTAGTFFNEEARTPLGATPAQIRRVVQVQCTEPVGTVLNPYARPLTGLMALVDLDAETVIDVVDTGAVTVPPPQEFDDNPRRSTSRPFVADIVDQTVRWGEWSFHWRVDPRVGPIVSVVTFAGRSVLYQGALSEIFVPYMDPDPEWHWRTFLDAGEYGFGRLGTTLRRGLDCPDGARFRDATVAWPGDGQPTVLDDAVCIFERDAAEPLWRHAEVLTNTQAGRARFDLVLRFTAELGLYSYTVDWVFGAGGDIGVEVIANGIDGVRAGAPAHHAPAVAPGLAAPAHDHYFNFRLDLDVDGPVNEFAHGRFVAETPTGAGGRAIWVVREQVAERERDGQARISFESPSQWRVRNPARGSGYVLVPGDNILPLGPPDDPGIERGAFARQHLWVTPLQPRERFAAGDYPNQNAGDGLPKWTAANRAIRNTDIVLWYTMGFRHVPAPEDWPVLNARKLRFTLTPFGFFERNPAVE
jgi:primary-amine oxidase